MNKIITLLLLLAFLHTGAQNVTLTKDQIISMTSEWKGERLPDGRPKVSDDLLARLKNISLEEAWGILRNKGYNNQFESDWTMLRDDQVLTGRALTVQYLPKRPDYDNMIREKGKVEKRIGNFNS